MILTVIYARLQFAGCRLNNCLRPIGLVLPNPFDPVFSAFEQTPKRLQKPGRRCAAREWIVSRKFVRFVSYFVLATENRRFL